MGFEGRGEKEGGEGGGRRRGEKEGGEGGGEKGGGRRRGEKEGGRRRGEKEGGEGRRREGRDQGVNIQEWRGSCESRGGNAVEVDLDGREVLRDGDGIAACLRLRECLAGQRGHCTSCSYSFSIGLLFSSLLFSSLRLA